MNYLIKTLFLVMVAIPISLLGQESQTIKVNGIYEWVDSPVKKTMEFDFAENGVTCGPNTEFETVEEQFSYFKFELLKDEQIANRITEVIRLKNYLRQKRITYSFPYNSEEEAKVFYKKASEAFAENFLFYEYYNSLDLDKIKEFAGFAIDDAFIKAKALAKSNGYNNVELLSIDEGKNFQAIIGQKNKSSYTKTLIKNELNKKVGTRRYRVSATFRMY